EGAAGCVAGEREVAVACGGLADRDDLAVALDRDPARPVGVPEVGLLLAVTREARVERSVRVVAGEREVDGGALNRDDLAVRLERHPIRPVEAAEVGRLL